MIELSYRIVLKHPYHSCSRKKENCPAGESRFVDIIIDKYTDVQVAVRRSFLIQATLVTCEQKLSDLSK